ncbi:MAG: hypothetical protein AB7T49_02350 [Oligoflexales bacterium]
MKKKLFDNDWRWRIISLALGAFFVLVAASFKAAIAPKRYGFVSVQMPINRRLEGEATPVDSKTRILEVNGKTPLVVLSESQFILGDVTAFTKTFSEVSNKISINHQKGAPHLGQLVKLINEKFPSNGQKVLVLLPTHNIPMSIVIQSIEVLKTQTPFSSVVLANGLW